MAFDRNEQILFVSFAGMRFETEAQIQRAFEKIRRFWVRECAGAKMYCVIDYTDFALDRALTAAWAVAVRHAMDHYAIAAVRYTTDISVRATLRAVAIKIHLPSNLYATREDAISVVQGLRANRIGMVDREAT